MVHPHVRGDDDTPVMTLGALVGSPPRAWGRCQFFPRRVGIGRFTPTCVGTILPPTLFGAWGPVHPHVRGDDIQAVIPGLPTSGSPPRAWGRFSLFSGIGGLDRFTPTCVGTMPCPAA